MLAPASGFGRGVAWIAIGNWTEQAINLAIFIFMARLLGAEAFGLLTMATAFVILCEFLVRESLSDYLISAKNPSPLDFDTVFWTLAAIGTTLGLILVLMSGVLAGFYGQPQVRSLILGLAPTPILIALAAVPVAILRREMRFRSLSLRAIAGVVVGGVVGITLALNGGGIWALVAQRLAQVGANFLLAWVAVGWRPGITITRDGIRHITGFSRDILALRASELASTQVPAVVIGATLGPQALGYFTIAWRMVEIASTLIIAPLRMAAQSDFAALRRDGGDPAAKLLRLAQFTGFLAFPVFAGLAALSAPFMALTVGPHWAPAISVLSVLSLYGAYLCVVKIDQAFCLAHGQVGGLAVLGLCEVMLGAAATLMLVPMGVTAMTLALIAAFLVMLPLRVRRVAKIAQIAPLALVQPQVLPFICAALMAGAIALLAQLMAGFTPLPILIAGTFLGIVVYGALSRVLMSDRLVRMRALGPAMGRRHSSRPS